QSSYLGCSLGTNPNELLVVNYLRERIRADAKKKLGDETLYDVKRFQEFAHELWLLVKRHKMSAEDREKFPMSFGDISDILAGYQIAFSQEATLAVSSRAFEVQNLDVWNSGDGKV